MDKVSYFKACTEANEKRVYRDEDDNLLYEEKMHCFGSSLLNTHMVLTFDQSVEYFEWEKSLTPEEKRKMVRANTPLSIRVYRRYQHIESRFDRMLRALLRV